ncbi:N-acetylmannosamine-6-phosphate 2-epimerase [Nonomuraea sp. KC401]|uniref:N-acetylmannosamine-6-phosphate 2-epimerase n=1 Tax=unclassified Nonomuraea TaxID=2593643 RepID=UPI0010FE611E|nr:MULTISPECIES: N-acetylmannosamine-6-phosphate 2-epimerase [unclassified Nonomuraea]NBE98154.1 putative N-acetylmannosamine-6-phosphate 2-epimerase [Nonomuraea sp. K271]TLF47507.1 N-acetylmannosamine-6-phosphate 2-epimerase [Nonomuraea sp. KC401]
MTDSEVFGLLSGGLVVSCQAYEGEPLHGPGFMTAMARSAVLGGAAGVRINGPADVEAVRAAVPVPLIGLWKDGDGDVYITPTLEHALAVVRAGADIVAVDATSRPRPDGRGLAETIAGVHRAGALVMADVATAEEGVAAAGLGADCVSTTLSGYTSACPSPEGPDLDLVAVLADALDVPVFAEGRIGTPGQAARAIELGAHAVVVGGAITRPADITRSFAQGLSRARP